jgi:hypothetical protein
MPCFLTFTGFHETNSAMVLSDAGQHDPSMLGQVSYPRSALDFYPTPTNATQALLEILEDEMESLQGWEPFCGQGHISKLVGPLCRSFLSTDIQAYEGFDPYRLMDFFQVVTDAELDAFESRLAEQKRLYEEHGVVYEVLPRPIAMREIAEQTGFRPDAIITNPPYDDKASGITTHKSVAHALKLMEPEQGMVAMLLRNEWDCAKKSRPFTKDHPAFLMKIVLNFRPRWIEGTKGSPRHNYSWYVWDWSKAIRAPHAKPEIRYAG